jgi:peptide/nickel transport system permease protein
MTLNENGVDAGESVSFGRMVWGRLQRNRVAIFGLRCIVGLVLLAIAAPLLSLNQPLFWSAGEGWQFPLLRALFNRLVFESAIDVLFNLVLVAGVTGGLVFALSPRRWKEHVRRHRSAWVRGVALGAVVFFVLLVPRRWIVVDNPLYFTERTEDYVGLRAQAEAAGQSVVAIFPPAPYGYRATDPTRNLQGPSGAHWLGTDTEGRDVFSRMLYGTRISLTIGVVAVSIYVSIGIILGALAGYFGGRVDLWISRLVEVMICFPSFFLILTIAALIEERSIFHVMLIIGLTSWTGVARLIRAEFLRNVNLEYVQAARALGIRQHRVIFRHVLPNAISPVLVTATFGVATAILVESSLAFLGVGDLTVASWGETLNTGRTEGKLWLVLAPGVAIFFVVSIINLVGEGLRDALDPKLNG